MNEELKRLLENLNKAKETYDDNKTKENVAAWVAALLAYNAAAKAAKESLNARTH